MTKKIFKYAEILIFFHRFKNRAISLTFPKFFLRLTHPSGHAPIRDTYAKAIWPKLNLERTLQCISLSRVRLQKVVGVVTGHCLIGAHSRKLGLGHLTNDFCRNCMDEEEEETILHFLGSCPALSRMRTELFGFYMSNNLSDFEKADVSNLSYFIERSKWF